MTAPPGRPTAEVLAVRDLRVTFPDQSGRWWPVVDRLSFRLCRREALALVGESGSGKTMTALSLLGLVPPPGRVSGSIRLGDRELIGLPEREWWAVRGRELGMVFQDALSALNPVRSVGSVLEETVRRHMGVSRAEARKRAAEALVAAGVPAPLERLRSYPHQLSGGLRQRVMIALAIVNEPVVMVADEPTTALDNTVQAEILELLHGLLARSALLLVTHDMGVVAGICDRVAVVYAGRMAEHGAAELVLRAPRHPYTAALLSAVPRLGRRGTLDPIAGQPPAFGAAAAGCPFAPRCPNALPRCSVEQPPLAPIDDRLAACWNPHDG